MIYVLCIMHDLTRLRNVRLELKLSGLAFCQQNIMTRVTTVGVIGVFEKLFIESGYLTSLKVFIKILVLFQKEARENVY